MSKSNKRTLTILLALGIGLLLVPIPSYEPTPSHILYSREGEILSASVSSKGQWCFDIEEELPPELQKSIILYEDAYYNYHIGVNPVSIFKAIFINYKSDKIKRGGSTIPMQVMRMKNRHVKRSYKNKFLEILAAIKYSLIKSKKEILKEWASISPFGGNVIGVKAASLFYFDREINNLSWSEYALLAVLPNSPSSMHLNKNRSGLLAKRNKLLLKLNKSGYISDDDIPVFLDEDLPKGIHSLPQKAYHFMEFVKQRFPSQKVMHSTLSYSLQSKLESILSQHSIYLQKEDIQNIAAVIIDNKKNEVLAYVGNVRSAQGKFRYVDIAQSPRSYGSLLKPLLYNYAIEKGMSAPYELIDDIPTEISGFRPKNFDKKYRGVVPFNEVMVKSLNVPSVRVLNEIGLDAYYDYLNELHLEYLNKGKNHYGLSIILGGGESSLWEMGRLYKGFAQNLLGGAHPYQEIKILRDEEPKIISESHYSNISLYYMAEAMTSLVRPRVERSWDLYETQRNIAWKTGTSYGHKDAWSLGFNKDYTVGVWVGNEDSEGRFNLTGVTKASPVMFEIFNNLPHSAEWFDQPSLTDDSEQLTFCKASGKLKGSLCNETYQLIMPSTSHKLNNCNYHQFNHNQPDNSDSLQSRKINSTFYLPPTQAYYYDKSNSYKIQGSSYAGDINNSNFNIIYGVVA